MEEKCIIVPALSESLKVLTSLDVAVRGFVMARQMTTKTNLRRVVVVELDDYCALCNN